MSLNSDITLTITTIDQNGERTMSFPNLQLGTAYNQVMQYAYVHFPEDEPLNENMSDMRETHYMGLTHLRNNLVAPESSQIQFLTTYSLERDTETIYSMRLTDHAPAPAEHQQEQQEQQQQQEEEDNLTVISNVSSQSIEDDITNFIQYTSSHSLAK